MTYCSAALFKLLAFTLVPGSTCGVGPEAITSGCGPSKPLRILREIHGAYLGSQTHLRGLYVQDRVRREAHSERTAAQKVQRVQRESSEDSA